ncbi:hypothetical protein P154DRAFT_334641 [Amniculicola lignicola CBS 123094]|uniref:Uncharacterized protein n=1 Tax=Amniculicola lignicola CBS 123094 TaxID=1392246 RepID=A0A6A5W9C3_9PLEO|nr:hypothetical protein P154DRAFT_334641 [Amniculicola lignicola CBS 123094]
MNPTPYPHPVSHPPLSSYRHSYHVSHPPPLPFSPCCPFPIPSHPLLTSFPVHQPPRSLVNKLAAKKRGRWTGCCGGGRVGVSFCVWSQLLCLESASVFGVTFS